MKFRTLVLALALVAGRAAATTLTGSILDPGGHPITGTLYLQLSANATKTGGACGTGAVSALPPFIFNVTAGSITGPGAGPYSVPGADCLTPSGLTYHETVTGPSGGTLIERDVSISGVFVDLNALPSITPSGPSSPPPISPGTPVGIFPVDSVMGTSATILTGIILSPGGTPVTGSLYMQLSRDANLLPSCGGPAVVANIPPFIYNLVNGVIVGPNTIPGASCLTPANLTYHETVTGPSGGIVLERDVFISGPTVDIGTITPITPSGPPITGQQLLGDVTGAPTANRVSKLQGITLDLAGVTNGQVIGYDSALAKWKPVTGGGGGGSGTVTSVNASGGTTGLSFTGGPITGAGTLTLGGLLGTASGGTGTPTTFTMGSVVFAGVGGVYAQNNSKFFWDTTNDRLGLGTILPAARLTVQSDPAVSTAISINGGFGDVAGIDFFDAAGSVSTGTLRAGPSEFKLDSAGTAPLMLNSLAGGEIQLNPNGGYVGVGVTPALAPLHLSMEHAPAADAAVYLDSKNATAQQASVVFRSQRAAGAALSNTDLLGWFGFRGGTGSGAFGSSSTALIGAAALENFTPSAQGTGLQFYTTPTGSTSRQLSMSLFPTALTVPGTVYSGDLASSGTTLAPSQFLASPTTGGGWSFRSIVAADLPPTPEVAVEQPTGAIDGSNKHYVLSHTPTSSRVLFIADNMPLSSGVDYVRSGVDVYLDPLANAPRKNVMAVYPYQGAADPHGTPEDPPYVGTADVWTAGTISGTFESIAYSPDLNLFCAVGHNNIATSRDGLTWTAQSFPTTPVASGWEGITWGNGQFVVMNPGGDGFNITTLTSPDGVTWTQHNSGVFPTTTGYGWNGVIWVQAAGKYITASSSNSGTNYHVARSSDGVTWTLVDVGGNYQFNHLAYSPSQNRIVGVGNSNGNTAYVMTSDDLGVTWALRTFSSPGVGNATIRNLIWSEPLGMFIASGYYTVPNGMISYSTTGVSWTNVNFSSGASGIDGLAWSDQRKVLVCGDIDFSTSSAHYASTPSGSWTIPTGLPNQNMRAIATNGPRFVAVGSSVCMVSDH